jgi:hypothetical protein
MVDWGAGPWVCKGCHETEHKKRKGWDSPADLCGKEFYSVSFPVSETRNVGERKFGRMN